ncbi:MAG TPA: ATP-binding protein, partial [Rhizomicrobium sp.]|nr:ATP-binding protein [Rhizomicrobium sp.]
MAVKPLTVDNFRLKTDPARLPFHSTAELPDADAPPGQERAMRALSFGARMREPGYNIYAMGAKGNGMHRALARALERITASAPAAPDWCYVHNFDVPQAPCALRLPAGEGAAFKQAMAELVAQLRPAMRALFDGTLYQARRATLEENFRATSHTAFQALRRAAEARGLALIEPHTGRYELVPQRAGVVLSDEALGSLAPAERARFAKSRRELRTLLDQTLSALCGLQTRKDAELRVLDARAGEARLRELIQPLYQRFGEHQSVRAYLNGVSRDLVKNLSLLQSIARGQADVKAAAFHRYAVNLFIDNTGAKCAPVVAVGLPLLSRLVGKVQNVPLSTTTDFMHIVPGALHRANGGFLLIEALELLQQEESWNALKRCLRERCVRIESLSDIRERAQTAAITPEPIALDVKVVLLGEPWVFDRVRALDPDFAELFKVQAEFSNTTERNDVHCLALLRSIASQARRDHTRHLDRSGAARLIDEAARMAGDAEVISIRLGHIYDLVCEANSFAADSGRLLITAWDIDRALAAKDDRAGRMKALELDLIRRRLVFIETDGARCGQVNALTVTQAGSHDFGAPARITASAGPGLGQGVRIDRLAQYAGRSPRRGGQTLAGYLNATYSPFVPLSLAASVAFEQRYGPIDGESASAAELIAILSAIANVPVAQGIGVTGSIDQHGAVLPVGSINQKIEGFFDVCQMRGLGPRHGVVIPKANVVNLMLRDDVAEAARRA